MHDDSQDLPHVIRDAVHDHNSPPPAPREAMWARIEAARSAPTRPDIMPMPVRRTAPRYAWPIGIAALIAIGIGIGRWSSRTDTATPVIAAAPATTTTTSPNRGTDADAAFRVAAAEHIAQTETFLTLFRASARSGRLDTLALPVARELLASNRLLSDSRAADDPRMRALLDDLELVLAQISELQRHRTRSDIDFITSGLDSRGVLPRLRATVPAGATGAPIIGET